MNSAKAQLFAGDIMAGVGTLGALLGVWQLFRGGEKTMVTPQVSSQGAFLKVDGHF